MRSFRKWSTVGSLVTVLSSANTAVLADIDKIKASAVVADFRLYFWPKFMVNKFFSLLILFT